jgi:hypothetical protein
MCTAGDGLGDRHDNSFLLLRTVPKAERPTAITTDITVNPGYVLIDARISVEAHRALSVFVRAHNLVTPSGTTHRLSRVAALDRGRWSLQRERTLIECVARTNARAHVEA